jgi:glycosyltransferase involved in cell wall biosynthesis
VLSFIIPAHNEEALLGRTLAALHASAKALGEPYEVIVADDASTDRTAAIAREHGGCVVAINRRQIAAARNAGARAAAGDPLFFVDADTSVTAAALRAAVRALRRGVVGGGCGSVRFDADGLPLYAAVMEHVLPPILRALRVVPGCFLFCTRRAYLAAGGFDETLYVAEEVAFSGRLKRQGQFVLLWTPVVTSARKLRARTALDLLRIGARLALGGRRVLQRREGLELWYGPRQDGQSRARRAAE